jgi:hypothetical protein
VREKCAAALQYTIHSQCTIAYMVSSEYSDFSANLYTMRLTINWERNDFGFMLREERKQK